MVGPGILSFSRSSRHLFLLYEPRMPKEKVTVSTFQLGRSPESLSLSGAYRFSLFASVFDCQSLAQSFGRVNSSITS